jgi:hypothetical protein
VSTKKGQKSESKQRTPKAKKPKITWRDKLKFRLDGPDRLSGLQTYYHAYREENNIPTRCDNPACQFHTKPLFWNDEPLPLIIDHKSGNSKDNSPENLQYLCGNCDSQRDNKGGSNIKKVVEDDATGQSYCYWRKGSRNYIMFPSGGSSYGGNAKTTADYNEMGSGGLGHGAAAVVSMTRADEKTEEP